MTSVGIVAGYFAAAMLLAIAYFRSYELQRPPIGTMNLHDVAFGLAAIILLPYVYLALPTWAIVTIVGMLWLAIISLVLGPITSSRTVRWLVGILVVGADIVAMTRGGVQGDAFRLVNNAVVVIVAVGIANLWAQSGLKARDLSVLAVGLTVFDVVATSHMTLMTDLVTRLQTVPLQPVVVWGPSDHPLGIGLGDLTIAALLSLVLLKAFGARLAIAGLVIVTSTVTTTLWVVQSAVFHATAFPAMAVIGPVTLVLCAAGTVTHGGERTTAQWRRAGQVP